MTSYVPLHLHSQYSMLDGVCSIKDIVKRLKEINVTKSVVSDHGNMFALTEWLLETKKAGMHGLAAIEFYISAQRAEIKENRSRKNTHVLFVAKNLAGFKQLVKLISRSNSNDCSYYRPRLSLEEIAEIIGDNKGNLIAITGHLGSTLADVIITENKETKIWHLNESWKTNGMNLIHWFHNIFGQENFGVEIQTFEGQRSGFKELVECNRELCKITGSIPIATADSHYAFKHQKELQNILLCVQMNKTLDKAKEDDELGIFFQSERFYIPSREELKGWGNTDEELDNTIKITENCEELEIFSSPKIPVAQIPKEFTKSIDYLTRLCREGYKKRYPENTNEYAQKIGERVKFELEVIEKCGLTDYFLLVHKIIGWCNQNDILTNVRGSAAGCMVNYLLGVSHVDPVKYGLIFERFFNEGRVVENPDGTKTYNLPDIDVDIQSSRRQEVIRWLREEYGHDNVGQIATFGTLKGRAALKDVCRVLGTVSEADVNQITQMMPEEHIITDELRELAEDFGYKSIIQYCLLNMEKEFAPYAVLNPEDNSISGPMAKEFTVARALEGITKNIGTHAGGVIINTDEEKLAEKAPFVKSGENDGITGIDMHNCERYGLIKLDLLGLSTLDSIKTMVDYYNAGKYKIYEKPKLEKTKE